MILGGNEGVRKLNELGRDRIVGCVISSSRKRESEKGEGFADGK